MRIPTFEEISPTNGLDLDEKSAAEHFFGKSQEEAAALFMDNAAHYEGYLLHMGGVAFAYYFPALLPYLESAESVHDAGVVFDILGTLDRRLDFDKESIRLARESIIEVLSYCLENYEKFDPAPEIYGNLRSQLENTLRCCAPN